MEFHFVWERTPLGIGLRPALLLGGTSTFPLRLRDTESH